MPLDSHLDGLLVRVGSVWREKVDGSHFFEQACPILAKGLARVGVRQRLVQPIAAAIAARLKSAGGGVPGRITEPDLP